MSILNSNQRPVYIFDASEKEHRRAYQQFCKTNCWGHLQYRFKVEAPFLNLVDMIQYKMNAYYLSKEFGDV